MPVAKMLGKNEVLQAWTTNPYTKTFRHLLPYNRHLERRKTFRDPIIKSAKPKDRIKYWNLVPGDQVRIRGEETKTIYEVLSINKLSNQIRLKVPSSGEKAVAKKVQYANLQLLVGHHAFPPKEGTSEPITAPVFATRMSTSTPTWNPIFKRWEWQRFAVNTIPRLSGPSPLDRINIPWPVPTPRNRGDAGLYDTPGDVVAEVTYTPPPLPADTNVPARAPPSEQAYIDYLSSPTSSSFDPADPVEVNLVREVSNPHSRAKKQRRWQERQRHEQTLLEEYVKAELKDLQGRTRREARAEASFKWKQRIEVDRKAELKRRWQLRGQEAKLLRKRTRAAKKEAKRNQKLADLTLEQGMNQVIPT